MAFTLKQLQQLVDQIELDYQSIEHPPLANCVEADRLGLIRPGTRLKHLFLRDNYGRRHFLLITAADKGVDLKALSKQLAVSRLGFASAERLEKYLGVSPGHVSLLALCNDSQHSVEILMDEIIWTGSALQCHPLDNRLTWVLSPEMIKRFLTSTGHELSIIDVPCATAQ